MKMQGRVEGHGWCRVVGIPSDAGWGLLFLDVLVAGNAICSLVLDFDRQFIIVFLLVACFLRWCLAECVLPDFRAGRSVKW